MDTQAVVEETKALQRVEIPEVVDLDTIRLTIGPSIDKELARAQRFKISIVDDESCALAIDAAEKLRDNITDVLNTLRETYYIEKFYRPGEEARELFDPRLKLAKGLMKDLMTATSEYKLKKEREARLARERAEAEARRQREEAERKQREAEEAERKAKEAAEAEKRRKEEAEAAEKRRIQAEQEAKEKAERDAREAAARETARKLKEEENARLAHATEAEKVGNTDKIEKILDTATPIAPVMAAPQAMPDAETQRIEQELARKRAEEKAEEERKAAAEAEERRKAAEAEAARKREEADKALAAAKAANAAAAITSAVVSRPDPRTVSVTRWKWDLDSDGTREGDIAAFKLIVKGVAEGILPVEYLGFDPDKPTNFRPAKINADVQEYKDRYACPGIKAYPQQDEQLRGRRKVGGR